MYEFSDKNIDWEKLAVDMSPTEVGRRIYKIRSDMGMSMESLADKVKKSRSTISRIERGNQELTLDQLCSIASILNVSHVELLCDSV